MTMKRPRAKGTFKTHPEPGWVPVQTHLKADRRLWFWCFTERVEDDRGRASMIRDVGFVTDGKWKLWFERPEARRGAEPTDFPYLWTEMEYALADARKKRGRLLDVSPVTVAHPYSVATGSSANIERLGQEMTRSYKRMSRRSQRTLTKLRARDLGLWQVESIHCPAFDLPFSERNPPSEVVVAIHPESTARTLLRIVEVAAMELTKPLKNSRLEPWAEFLKFLSAMDPYGVGHAVSFCDDHWVKAFSKIIPEPDRSFGVRRFSRQASHENQVAPPPTVNSQAIEWMIENPKAFAEALGMATDELRITVEQIAVDIAQNRYAATPAGLTAAQSTRRIRQKIKKLGLAFHTNLWSEGALLLSDYRKHRMKFLRHGNQKARRPSD